MGHCYNVPEVAAHWGVTSQTVYNLLRSGKLKGFKIGRDWRISEEAVHAFETGEPVKESTPLKITTEKIVRIS